MQKIHGAIKPKCGDSMWNVGHALVKPAQARKLAFTRVEVLAVLCALALIALIVAPAIAVPNGDSKRAICANNLRLVGRAVWMWAGDHENRSPWWVPRTEGGSWEGTRPGAAWVEFASLSNELVTPKILACPADVGVLRANRFNDNPPDGFVYFPHRANALSYGVAVHSMPDTPRVWLSGDRNMATDGPAGSCVTGLNNLSAIALSGPSALAWTNEVAHGEFGNVLFSDGSVEFTSTERLREVIRGTADAVDSSQSHFLRAR